MKRFIGIMLIFVFLLNSLQIGVAAAPFATTLEVGHLPGESYKTVTQADVISVENAVAESTGVRINAGGSATFGFSTRYALANVTLKFEGASGTTTITTKDNVYTTTEISGTGEYKLVFGENLGIEPQAYDYNDEGVSGYYREYVENRGEHEVTVSTTGGMYLTEMVFEKDKTPIGSGLDTLFSHGVSNITDQEKQIMSTVALREDGTVILVNGARRYIDNDDVDMRPYKENNTLYLPINTLAKALDYYNEDYPEKGYALLRNDTHEYVLLDGRQTVSQGTAEPKAAPFDAIIYRDGKTLAALRYFAELAGETVLYRNGLVIIDDKYAAADIMENNSMRGYIDEKLMPFNTESVAGNTYYVAQKSPVASDTNDGSAFAPFKTIEKAANIAKAGDTVIVHEGVYRETLKPGNSGEENAPITFKAAEGEKVVISAADELTTWAQTEDGTYVTHMPWTMGVTRNQIYIDGEVLTEAKHPNTPGIMRGEEVQLNNNLWPVRGDLYREGGSENRNVVKSATQLWQDEEDYWKGGIFVGLFGWAYTLYTGNIVASKPGELTIGSEKTNYWPTVPATFSTASRHHFNYGYIVGHKNALDVPGEWIWEENSLYMIFPDGKTPENSTVEAKARNLVIDLNDKKFINVVGFETMGGSARMNNSEMCMINGLNMKYVTHFLHTADEQGGYIDFDYSKGLNSKGDYTMNRKDQNGAPERGEVGIYIAGKDNIFVNSHVDHSAGAGLFLTGLYTHVENNILNDVGYMGNYIGGIVIGTKGYENYTAPRGGHLINNNTVYNVGRACILSVSPDGKTVAFLPSDIGYNDFHDGVLCTADTGITYNYMVNMTQEGMAANEHHNYVYITTDAIDQNPFAYGIYHDNGSMGMNSYKNMVFFTDKDGGITKHYVYSQTMDGTAANFLSWDQGKIGYTPDDVDKLSESYFTEDRPFFAGSLQGVDYVENYNKFKEGRYGMEYSALEAELSEGVSIDEETGYASFTADGQYIKFSDVEFDEKANVVALSVRGSYTNTYDKVEVIIGDDIETGSKYDTTVQIGAPDRDIPNRVTLQVRPPSGKQDVYVRVADYNSVEIGGLSTHLIDFGNENENDEYALYTYSGNFTDWGQFDAEASPSGIPTPMYEGTSPCMNNTFPGYYVKYENLEFTAPADKFAIVAGSGSKYKQQPIEVYVDGMDADDMVCKFIVESLDWNNTATQLVALNRVIPQGKHDVYLKFATDAGYEKSSNVRQIGFVKEGVTLDEFKGAKVKVFGGDFDESLSVQNADYPFRAELMNPPNFKKRGLTYTLPGTVAGYKDINININATKFTINYSSEEGIDGQPVEVRVGSLNSEPIASFVTEGNGLMNFNELTFELAEPIPAGIYNVYISFGGQTGAKINTKLDWFGFDN